MRYKYARGPVCTEIKQKLVEHLQTQTDLDTIAEDIIELIAVGRNDREGFRAVSAELDRLKSLGIC